jgi:hypothetical protein
LVVDAASEGAEPAVEPSELSEEPAAGADAEPTSVADDAEPSIAVENAAAAESPAVEETREG